MSYRRGPAVLRACEAYTQAVALDPQYAAVWAGLADAHALLGIHGAAPVDEAMHQATDAASRAVALDPSSAEAHTAIAGVALFYEWDWKKAERELLLALELNPGYVPALIWYGLNYLVLVEGRFEDGLAEVEKGLRLDPLSGYVLALHACVLGFMGRYDDAVAHARSAVECDRDSFVAHWMLQSVCYWGERYEESVAAGEAGLAVSGRHPVLLAAMATTFAAWGRPDKAKVFYDEVVARAATAYVQPSVRARAAAAVGQQEEAVTFAQQAYDERDPQLTQWGRCWPAWDVLRSDARFQALLGRMNFPGTLAVPNQVRSSRGTGAAPEPSGPAHEVPSIAVLPFTNMSGDPEQE